MNILRLFLFVFFVSIVHSKIEGCAPWEDNFSQANAECNAACMNLNCSYGYCANDNPQREFGCKCVGQKDCNNGNPWLD